MWHTLLTRDVLFIKTALFALMMVLNACTSITDHNRDMQDTKDSGPTVPVNVSHIPNATPHPVVRTTAGNKSPYVVFGKRYTVLTDSHGFRQRGDASWYGTKFHGNRTSNGEIYNMYAMTAAHKSLPIPSYVKVTNVANRRSVVVRVNDRGPFHSDRIIDLSYAAAKKLGYAEMGVAPVIVEDVTPKTDSGLIASEEADSASTALATSLDTTNSDTVKVSEHLPSFASPPAYVQVGAFRQRQTAEQLRIKLMAIIKHPVAVARSHDDWYRVRIGPVHTVQSVAYLRRDLESRGHAKPLVVYE
jgi:rare lipoprotein A